MTTRGAIIELCDDGTNRLISDYDLDDLQLETVIVLLSSGPWRSFVLYQDEHDLQNRLIN